MINLLDVIKKKKLPIYISSLERENFLKEVGGLIGKITRRTNVSINYSNL